VEELNKMSKAIFLATEFTVASDISNAIKWAIAEITRLKAEVEIKALKIEKAVRILTMGSTSREREAFHALTIKSREERER